MTTSDNDNNILQQRRDMLRNIFSLEIRSRVTALTGLTVEVKGFPAPLGAQCKIITRMGREIAAEVIGFRDEAAILMPLAEMIGISRGDWVHCLSLQAAVPIGPHLLGRVINGYGQPIDGKGPLLCGNYRTVQTQRLEPLQRRRIDAPLGTGVRVIDALVTCGRGQRLGIFSGPGVGKSILLGMIGRYTSADVTVIALVGERSREVREFIEKDLTEEGLARSVVVVSTADEPPPIRVQAGFVASTIAEYFRDQNKDVLLLMDSVTRIAMAQRQIGLAMGEPPATKGYTPSVFALLPNLLERCGRSARGSITGFYTVLVEGDDISEPISDAMRGILDGHLWLSRDLANRRHYPAVDILQSISRVMIDVVDEPHKKAARDIIRLIAVYRDIEDLVNIGAYAPGTNPDYDLAINSQPLINKFLRQDIEEGVAFSDSEKTLKELSQTIINMAGGDKNPDAGQEFTEKSKPRSSSIGLERMMAGI